VTGPRVSVVVPTYQNAPFVEETIRSVLTQTFADFELVIADHTSTDGTWEKVQRFLPDPRVRLLRTEPGGGAARNWNLVTQAARGELLKLVCADDLLHPTCLAEQVADLDAEPTAVMVACRRHIVDARGGTVVRARGLPRMAGLVAGRDAVRLAVRAGTNVFGEPVCVTVRRRVLLDVGGWDGSQPYLIDQATYAKVLRHGDLVAQHRVLATFRVSAQQWSVALFREQARQAAGFHRSLMGSGGVVSASDVRLGNVRAFAIAHGRRLAYLRLGARMHAEPG
jgi:glycosyltransferase involved in cell wall biosynthesis